MNGLIPGGRIEVVSSADAGDIRLRLVADRAAEFRGYYHFRASGLRGQDCMFRIMNAGDTLATRLAGRDDVENAWTHTGPAVSYDREHWFRLAGAFDGQVFSFGHRPPHDVCHYASWAPYGMDRQLDFIARAQMSPRVRVTCIGRSVLGADIDMLTIGAPGADKRHIWVIARQHPSETQGGFFIEGFVGRMLDEHDPVARDILRQAVVYVVPNMNPDGTMNGWARANALGVNLNREWVSPSAERSPEVLCVRDLMEATGVDFCVDCHADSELRCNFLGGPLEIPSRSPRLRELFHAFERSWAAASPDYELGHPYPGGSPAEADLRMAWNWIADRFDCLSILLEQPFKDTSWWVDAEQGWSPERATRFGSTLPTAIHGVLPRLR